MSFLSELDPSVLRIKYGRSEYKYNEDLKWAISHILNRCFRKVENLDWSDMDPFAAMVLLDHLGQYIFIEELENELD